MQSSKAKWLALTAFLGASTAAHAGFYYSDASGAVDATTSVYTINGPGAGYNDFASQLASQGVTQYYLGTSLAVDGPGTVQFSLMGKEAGYTNQLTYDGAGVVLTTSGVSDSVWKTWATTPTYSVSGGLLSFAFCIVNPAGCLSNAANDAAAGSPKSIGIFIVNATTAWLLWDDSGAGPDDNHDDMIVKVTYTAVPEPATSLLFGLGLVGVGLALRRKRAADRIN